MARQPKCPICRTPVKMRSENKYFPFCSNRCKSEDLGKWLNEDYRMPVGQEATERKLRATEHSTPDDESK